MTFGLFDWPSSFKCFPIYHRAHSYSIASNEKSWSPAKRRCQQRGGYSSTKNDQSNSNPNVSFLQSIEELEKEMLNGQKLQGPPTAAEVNAMLKEKDMEEKYVTSKWS